MIPLLPSGRLTINESPPPTGYQRNLIVSSFPSFLACANECVALSFPFHPILQKCRQSLSFRTLHHTLNKSATIYTHAWKEIPL